MPVLQSVRDAIRDPVDGSALAELTTDAARFASGRAYPCMDGRPILIDERSSLFSVAEIQGMSRTTQDRDYRDPKQLKNLIRQRVLPSLTWDRTYEARCKKLATQVTGRPVLVVGAGDQVDDYRRQFDGSPVVTSDVHLQFGADCAVDAHKIPFADRFFGLVLAMQVLEHTSRPWQVAAEMERVAGLGGIVHVEVPFSFPYHGAPYDFFRFTPSALRFLFAQSELVDVGVTEGRFSSAAVYLSNGVVDTFAGRRLRQLALAGTRLGLWWMKYLDVGAGRRRFHSPKGLYVTVKVDGRTRTEREMLDDVKAVVR